MSRSDPTAPRRPHGALKAAVTEVLLHSERSLTAREIRERFNDPVPGMTTLLTVLDRLRRAGQIHRSVGTDGDYGFSLVEHDADAAAGTMIETLLRSNDRTGALLNFAGALDAEDVAVLRRAIDAGHQRND
ncbi:MAG TPA: hypothetical protein VFE15_01625 [Marmoricola sp.]|jgi:predicted transcriptional regulator|nr:hypothetical protein [Marmoricola sp.]